MDLIAQPNAALPPGLIIAAPRSGSGKTTVTLGLLEALTAGGLRVQSFKCGPDYIDPAFHCAATRLPSCNLDSWAMRRGTVSGLLAANLPTADLAICEGVMGLFDGAATPGAWGNGATADIAVATGWPVVLVLDVSGQAQTAAAVVLGCARMRPDVTVAGVILNRVGSERHRRLVTGAMLAAGYSVLGALPRRDDLALPERHLGLVQAVETVGLQDRLTALRLFVEEHVDLAALKALAASTHLSPEGAAAPKRPPGQRIALARDAAFSFMYPHLLDAWRRAGTEILPFSPLNDEPPAVAADAVWLPGGYPELHGGRLASAKRFLAGLGDAAAAGKSVHGECGGFMVMGLGLIDAKGVRHAMAGLLNIETSFERRKLHLGYRRAVLAADGTLGKRGDTVRGHEFHYASLLRQDEAPLATITDADGVMVAETGAQRGNVSGSFFHLIDAAP